MKQVSEQRNLPILVLSHGPSKAQATHRLAMQTRVEGRKVMLFVTEDAAGYRAYLRRVEEWALKTLHDADLPTDLRAWELPDGQSGVWNVLSMVEHRRNSPEWFAARILFYLRALHNEEEMIRRKDRKSRKKAKRFDPNFRPRDWDSMAHLIGLASCLAQESDGWR